jgi:hypothetical protein
MDRFDGALGSIFRVGRLTFGEQASSPLQPRDKRLAIL